MVRLEGESLQRRVMATSVEPFHLQKMSSQTEAVCEDRTTVI